MNKLQSFSARTGQPFGAALSASTPAQIDSAAEQASALQAQRESLVPLADEETGLGPVRLNGELDRTAFQLRRFADIAERVLHQSRRDRADQWPAE